MPGRRRAASSATARGAAALIVIMLATAIAGGGCELIVPSSVSSVKCTGESASACPGGQVCAPGPGQCVPASQACSVTGCTPPATCDPASQQCVASPPSDGPNPFGMDSSDETGDAVPPSDSPVPPPDSPAPDAACGGVAGCACTGPAQCQSGICADSSLLPTLTGSGFFCTQACCSSADCPNGTVCYGSGGPGNYCVPFALLSRQAPGTGQPGTGCSSGTECRSGSCSANACLDTCCSDLNCATGTYCALDPSPVDGHMGFFCLAHSGPGADAGGACTNNADCLSGACYTNDCRPHCCGTASCLLNGFHACERFTAGSDHVEDCTYPTGFPTGLAPGFPCTDDGQCVSRACDPDAHSCTEFCCVDSDCAPLAGLLGGTWACRPEVSVTPRYLVCVKTS